MDYHNYFIQAQAAEQQMKPWKLCLLQHSNKVITDDTVAEMEQVLDSFKETTSLPKADSEDILIRLLRFHRGQLLCIKVEDFDSFNISFL